MGPAFSAVAISVTKKQWVPILHPDLSLVTILCYDKASDSEVTYIGFSLRLSKYELYMESSDIQSIL